MSSSVRRAALVALLLLLPHAAGAQAPVPTSAIVRQPRPLTVSPDPASSRPTQSQAPSSAPAQQTGDDSTWVLPAPAFDDYFRALGHSFTRGMVAREQLVPLGIGAAFTAAVLPFDHDISARMHGANRPVDRAAHFLGHPITLGVVSGGMLLASLQNSDPRFRSYAFTLSQGLIVAQTVTSVIKLAVPRNRPDKRNRFSFPSGHAAGAVALAVVSWHYYGPKAGIPLVGMAALVGAGRVYGSHHFPSDVMAGATVGYISARAAILGTEAVTVPEGPAATALAPMLVGGPPPPATFVFRVTF